MDLIKQIEDDLSQVIKEKKELAVLTLRQLKTALVNAQIAKKRKALTTEEALQILKTEVKRRQEAARLYRQGSRPELAEKEEEEIKVIKNYLPAELSSEAITVAVKQVITEMNANGPKDAGKVMGKVMALLKGQAGGRLVSEIVSRQLARLKDK